VKKNKKTSHREGGRHMSNDFKRSEYSLRGGTVQIEVCEKLGKKPITG